MAADGVRGSAYEDLVRRVRATVAGTVPAGARVAVVNKGDDALLRLGARVGWHFPRTRTGLYAGFYPASGAEAVEALERVREAGAEFLVVPETAAWWLDHYPELAAHLTERCELVTAEAGVCAIYALAGRREDRAGRVAADPAEALVAPQVSAWLDAVLPPSASVVVLGPGADAVGAGTRTAWRSADGPRDPRGAAALVDRAARDGASHVVVLRALAARDRTSTRPLWQAARAHGRLLGRQALAELYALHDAGGGDGDA